MSQYRKTPVESRAFSAVGVHLITRLRKLSIMTPYEFYGDGCPHCERMAPKVKQLEDKKGVEVEQLEVWNDQENAEKHQELDDGKCGGVPFFYNTETEEWICGEADMEKLKTWVNGGKAN